MDYEEKKKLQRIIDNTMILDDEITFHQCKYCGNIFNDQNEKCKYCYINLDKRHPISKTAYLESLITRLNSKWFYQECYNCKGLSKMFTDKKPDDYHLCFFCK